MPYLGLDVVPMESCLGVDTRDNIVIALNHFFIKTHPLNIFYLFKTAQSSFGWEILFSVKLERNCEL